MQSGHVAVWERQRLADSRSLMVVSLPAAPRAVAEIKVLKLVSFTEVDKVMMCGCESKGDTLGDVS